MTPDKLRYEVWQETVQGVWSLAHEDDGTQHFDDQKRAEKLQDSLLDEGMLRQAVLVKVEPVKVVNCVGAVVAKRMGLNKAMIQGSFKIRTGEPGTIDFQRRIKS